MALRIWTVTLGCALVLSTAHGQQTVPEIKARASRGDADAQLRLGLIYATGNGVRKDMGQAVA